MFLTSLTLFLLYIEQINYENLITKQYNENKYI